MKKVLGSVYGFLAGLATGDDDDSVLPHTTTPTAAQLESAHREILKSAGSAGSSAAAVHTDCSIMRPLGTLYVRRALYRLPIALDLLPAARTTDAAGLSYGGESSRELDSDSTDRRVRLSQLINSNNRLTECGDCNAGDSDEEFVERRLLVEIALVVVDSEWDPAQTYVRAHMSNVAARCETTVVLGDRQVALARSSAEQQKTTPRSPAAAAAEPLDRQQRSSVADGRACSLNSNSGVEGWCVGCGTRPTMTTLFQTPLSDEQLMFYATELCSELGTHEHAVVRNELLEVSDESSVAQQMLAGHSEGVAREETSDGYTGVLFIQPDTWRREMLDARRVLDNLPLIVDDKSALVVLSARSGDGHVRTPPRSLDIVLAAQCLEFVRK